MEPTAATVLAEYIQAVVAVVAELGTILKVFLERKVAMVVCTAAVAVAEHLVILPASALKV
jgi:hypothetical protein